MLILAMDTSTKTSSLAIGKGDKILGSLDFYEDLSHSERLIPMVNSLLAGLGLVIEDVDCFAVGLGPGSFTGLRIGVGTIKAFAHVSGKPIIGVESLKAMALQAGDRGLFAPVLDARRNRVYSAVYEIENSVMREIEPIAVRDIDDMLEDFKKYDLTFCGQDANILGEKISSCESFSKAPLFTSIISAESIVKLAYQRACNSDFDNVYTLIPEYALLSQAERELKNGKI